MSIIADTSPTGTKTCQYDWCAFEHSEFAGTADIHIREFRHGPVEFDFVLDDGADAEARTYISWTTIIEEEFAGDRLQEINDYAAALIVGKAAFDRFVEEVSK